MTPFRADFTLSTPMSAPAYPIHLDGVLAYAAMEAADWDEAALDTLPLQRYVADDGRWVWKASQMRLSVVLRERIMRSRTFEPWSWGDDRNVFFTGGPTRVTAGTGAYKSYILESTLVHVSIVRAWGVGDIDGVQHLLSKITHLGALRRLDMGRISKCVIEEDPAAIELWKHRAMPDERDGYAQCVATMRPPYHLRSARESCWVPLTRSATNSV